MGRPGGGLFDGGNPDKQLLWCIGFLAMVGGLSNAICRERDGRREAEFASLMPGFCEAVWPLGERRVLLESLKRWSAHGEKVERRYLSSAIRLGRFRRDWQTRMWSSRPFGAATLPWSCFVHGLALTNGIAPGWPRRAPFHEGGWQQVFRAVEPRKSGLDCHAQVLHGSSSAATSRSSSGFLVSWPRLCSCEYELFSARGPLVA